MPQFGRISGGHRVVFSKNQIDTTPPTVLKPSPFNAASADELLRRAQLEHEAYQDFARNQALAADLLSFDKVGECPKCKGTMTFAHLFAGEKVHYCEKCRVAIPLPLTTTAEAGS